MKRDFMTEGEGWPGPIFNEIQRDRGDRRFSKNKIRLAYAPSCGDKTFVRPSCSRFLIHTASRSPPGHGGRVAQSWLYAACGCIMVARAWVFRAKTSFTYQNHMFDEDSPPPK